jgi:hypothetical protein
MPLPRMMLCCLPGGSLYVERERALEQFLDVGKHALVEINAAEVVQGLRQFEIRTRT